MVDFSIAAGTDDAGVVLERLANTRALVVGDAMWDVYHFGRVVRISPEAPVPIFVMDRSEERCGGASNVVANLEALTVKAAASFGRQRSIKERFMVGHQMVFRIDRDVTSTPDFNAKLHLANRIRRHEFDVVVLSDYAKGWLTFDMCSSIIEAANDASIPVVVDPKGSSWEKYQGASVICPNEKEWAETGCFVAQAIVVKQGERGLSLYYGGNKSLTFPARARHVYDVTGAGDTVTATIAAVLGAGGSLKLACELAVLTSGWVVGEVGTAVCPLSVLKDLILGRNVDVQKDAPTQEGE